jgi:hypothetical protein
VPHSARSETIIPVVGSYLAGQPQWLQSRNCFVALLGKVDDSDTGHPADAERVLECLDEAFVAWQPNLIQVLISEIQNILELDALATDEDELRDPATHTGLSYYVLQALDDGADHTLPELLASSLQTLIDKIVETLRHKLVADPMLRELGGKLLSEELRALEWPVPRTEKKLFEAATTMTRSRAPKKPDESDSLFALNSFLSTEQFRRAHLTTGTVFKNTSGTEYWICASPSCDMVARMPSPFQTWARALHPLRAMVAVRLQPVKLNQALKSAEQGRHAFLTDGKPLAFSVVDEQTGQPVYEFFFAENAAVWREDELGLKSFSAGRIKNMSKEPYTPELVKEKFVIVGQLRPSYATRILHLMGQHLSRVGLDFVSARE